VGAEELVVQGLVAVLERGEEDVLLDVRRLAAEVVVRALELLFRGRDVRGQQSLEAEVAALLLGEGISRSICPRSGTSITSSPES